MFCINPLGTWFTHKDWFIWICIHPFYIVGKKVCLVFVQQHRQNLPGWPTISKITKCASGEHFTVQWVHRRGVVNGNEHRRSCNNDNLMDYIWMSFVPHTHSYYITYICKVIIFKYLREHLILDAATSFNPESVHLNESVCWCNLLIYLGLKQMYL